MMAFEPKYRKGIPMEMVAGISIISLFRLFLSLILLEEETFEIHDSFSDRRYGNVDHFLMISENRGSKGANL